MPDNPPCQFTAVILMGVSGSGKTTIGQLLAAQSGCDFIEGDDYHPPKNVFKMANGIPLSDADRQPWLTSLHEVLYAHAQTQRSVLLACSALKQNYRQTLAAGIPNTHFIYLKGDYGLIAQRLAERPNHYMKAGMLASQFETLQEPEDALVVDIAQSPQIICRIVREYLDRD
ncbi:gluconokinase [Pelolinea submarina]|uniref:Gluconokinase n=1 Tax=Pelolinea submarina TaxID=913107 RepID=A0A347ZWG5_9CHLR|nr:gluconokinase [Pelolinea submarina]REG05389.1 gluconate kinase (SKI family) [Pelolinea submarina]BBB49646.1 gluconokinase [Pelolinea submarina]